jgi:hypothetical protein
VGFDGCGDLVVLMDAGGVGDEAGGDALGVVQDDGVEERVSPGLVAWPVRGEARSPFAGGADQEVDGERPGGGAPPGVSGLLAGHDQDVEVGVGARGAASQRSCQQQPAHSRVRSRVGQDRRKNTPVQGRRVLDARHGPHRNPA